MTAQHLSGENLCSSLLSKFKTVIFVLLCLCYHGISTLKLAFFWNKLRRNLNTSVKIFKTFYGNPRTWSRKSKKSVDCVELYWPLYSWLSNLANSLKHYGCLLVLIAVFPLTTGIDTSMCLSEKHFQMQGQGSCSRCPWDSCCDIYLAISTLGHLKSML